MRRSGSTLQVVVRALCVIALLAVGFSHRAPSFASPALSAAEVAAMTLPDGSVPELCLPGDMDDGKAQSGFNHCEACLISASVLLPAPADVTGKRLPAVVEVLLPPRVEAFYRQLFPPNAAPRAPPHPAFA
ncbi:hypothetical protein C0075_04635 [Rhizobium sp. KAs_5_22]|uniref:DUF2946 family protein n=1 Tax=Ciceribacter selenitireducens TaxID=448181 RepID=UPI00048DFD70|nr:DUF2946 family protein [Ciceribacter selenitireducens]PPJ45065.1 hypothetical protein C0075_04635 [Rhizobium sp. KAs_5_22]